MQVNRDFLAQWKLSRERRARALFWGLPARWPLPWNEGVHLVLAAHQVGQAIFGEKWTGREAGIAAVGELPPLDRFLATPDNCANVSAVLVLAGILPPTLSLLEDDAPLSFDAEHYEQARALTAQLEAEQPENLRRFASVIECMRVALGRGMIASMLREVAGGPYSDPLPIGQWQLENPMPRFTMGKMNPASPFEPAFDGPLHRWIFIHREGLHRLLSDLRRQFGNGDESNADHPPRNEAQPAALAAPVSPDPEPLSIYSSGSPGRPSSMQLVELEFRRRVAASETATSNSAEAKALSDWVAKTYPSAPRLTAKTIRNKIPGWRQA